MVRFLKAEDQFVEDATHVDRYVTIERLVALGYIPSAILLSLGSLGGAGVVPFMATHEWSVLLASGAFLAVANGRDVNHCIATLFPAKEGRSPGAKSPELESCALVGDASPSEERKRGAVRGHMLLGAAVALTMGSLSLVNGSVIGLVSSGSDGGGMELCIRHIAAGFGLLMIGAAGNAAGGMVRCEMEEESNLRMVVCFLQIVGSGLLCMGNVLQMPSMKVNGTGAMVQWCVIAICVVLGSGMICMSAVLGYLRTVELLWCQEVAFEREVEAMEAGEARRRNNECVMTADTQEGLDEAQQADDGMVGREGVLERLRLLWSTADRTADRTADAREEHGEDEAEEKATKREREKKRSRRKSRRNQRGPCPPACDADVEAGRDDRVEDSDQ